MVWRNSLLIGALIAGVAIIVVMYVRRGMSDLQGQIDDIETVLAAMPPALTSGQFNLASEYSGAQPAGPMAVAEPQYAAEAPSYDMDGGFAQEFDESIEGSEGDEYSLDDTNVGVANLVEPGVYQSGVVELHVTAADEGMPEMSYAAIEEIDETVSVNPGAIDGPIVDNGPSDDSDKEEGEVSADNDAVNAVIEDAIEYEEDTTAEVSSEQVEASPVGDEFDILTLPELKARLKATQPEAKGIARMKRAEVLDRLRSAPAVEDSQDN